MCRFPDWMVALNVFVFPCVLFIFIGLLGNPGKGGMPVLIGAGAICAVLTFLNIRYSVRRTNMEEACRHLHRSRYIRMPDLLEMFNLAEQTGRSISSTVTKLANYHVLIIDEWLLDIPSEREIKYLLEIFEKRHDQWPTIFCTQYKISEWHPRLGGGVIADAILDRIVHNSEIINLGSKNMREFYSAKPVIQ